MNTDSINPVVDRPRPRSRRLRRAVFVVAAVVTLVVLFYAVEDWRGRRAWEQCQQELTALGERMDWAAYVPARVPDAENFVKTPLLEAVGYRGQVDTNAWAPIARASRSLVWPASGDWQCGRMMNWTEYQSSLRDNTNFSLPPLPQTPAADLLFALQPIAPQLAELRAASVRPRAQFDTDRSAPFEEAYDFNFVAVRSLSQILAFHACAELEMDHSEQAFADVRVIHRLADALENETTLVATMIRMALQGLALQPFWEGWAAGRWNEPELAEFQRCFARVDLLPELAHTLRAERAGVNALLQKYGIVKNEMWRVFMRNSTSKRGFFDQAEESATKLVWRLIPRGWVFQNMVSYDWRMQAMLPAGLTRTPATVSPREVEQLKHRVQSWNFRSPYEFCSAVTIPNFTKATENITRTQVFLNEAQIVCALERYRKARGQFPETLPQLVPQFIDKLPHDVITGGPLQYRRSDEGKFVLYSVGWNEKDNGGVPAFTKDRPLRPDFTQGDWVWMWPTQ